MAADPVATWRIERWYPSVPGLAELARTVAKKADAISGNNDGKISHDEVDAYVASGAVKAIDPRVATIHREIDAAQGRTAAEDAVDVVLRIPVGVTTLAFHAAKGLVYHATMAVRDLVTEGRLIH
jgi:hypothetical protein